MASGNDIQVEVETDFVWQESDPVDLRYVFAYTITITNRGMRKSRLVNRHWLITDGDGSQECVEGTGVVGRQPVLSPGESLRYARGAVLETPFGTMEGHYEFESQEGDKFRVPIDPFILAVPDEEEN